MNEINKLIAENEEIALYDDSVIKTTIAALRGAGFIEINCKKIINGYPNILRLNPNEIKDRLEMWKSCQFTPTQYYDLFVQCPELIEFHDEAYFSKRFGQLRSIVGTPKNIWRLLMSSPNVYVDDWKLIQKKVDYVLKDMEADETDLIKSGTLGLPLNTIRTRHALLVRLGIYKKRNWKASELRQDKNPRLFRIMDVDDTQFAMKTCGISTRELQAFYDLYERELTEKHQDEIELEEDSDTESDTENISDDEDFDARETNDYYDNRNRLRYQKHRDK